MFHVVDDLPELRGVLRDLIECAGYACMQFDSTESYLEYFNSPEFVAPVAILTDYQMPGKTGLELIKQVREKLPLQKAVIVSGTYAPELHTIIESYLCHSLTKPYNIEEMFSLLEMLVTCENKYQSKSAPSQARCEFSQEHKCPHYSGSAATE
jgi:DNA-binding NtrC family response regulator